jgi:peptide/nickel transport system substrate-binding protein
VVARLQGADAEVASASRFTTAKFDGAAVKFSIERHKTLAGSNRRGELAPVASVDVVDESTVQFNLSSPSTAGVDADRPCRDDGLAEAAQAAGRTSAPSRCARTVPLRRARRAGQDRPRCYRTTGTGRDGFDRVVYLPIVDSTVRLANLKSGQLDFIERRDVRIWRPKNDKRFRTQKIVEIGYQG